MIFASIALNWTLEKVGPAFSWFDPCPYPQLPSIAIEDRNSKKFQCLNVVLNNKTGPLFLKFVRRQVLAV